MTSLRNGASNDRLECYDNKEGEEEAEPASNGDHQRGGADPPGRDPACALRQIASRVSEVDDAGPVVEGNREFA